MSKWPLLIQHIQEKLRPLPNASHGTGSSNASFLESIQNSGLVPPQAVAAALADAQLRKDSAAVMRPPMPPPPLRPIARGRGANAAYDATSSSSLSTLMRQRHIRSRSTTITTTELLATTTAKKPPPPPKCSEWDQQQTTDQYRFDDGSSDEDESQPNVHPLYARRTICRDMSAFNRQFE